MGKHPRDNPRRLWKKVVFLKQAGIIRKKMILTSTKCYNARFFIMCLFLQTRWSITRMEGSYLRGLGLIPGSKLNWPRNADEAARNNWKRSVIPISWDDCSWPLLVLPQSITDLPPKKWTKVRMAGIAEAEISRSGNAGSHSNA